MVLAVVCERTRVEEASPSNTGVNFILKGMYDEYCRLKESRVNTGDTAVEIQRGRCWCRLCVESEVSWLRSA